MEIDVSREGLAAGRFEGGRFELRLEGSTVTSVEGAGLERLASIEETTDAAEDGF